MELGLQTPQAKKTIENNVALDKIIHWKKIPHTLRKFRWKKKTHRLSRSCIFYAKQKINLTWPNKTSQIFIIHLNCIWSKWHSIDHSIDHSINSETSSTFFDSDMHQFNDRALGLKYIEILLLNLKIKCMKCKKTGYYVFSRNIFRVRNLRKCICRYQNLAHYTLNFLDKKR